MYPVTKFNEFKAAKLGLSYVKDINEKNVNCTTANIYIAIIFPEINPTTKKIKHITEIIRQKMETKFAT